VTHGGPWRRLLVWGRTEFWSRWANVASNGGRGMARCAAQWRISGGCVFRAQSRINPLRQEQPIPQRYDGPSLPAAHCGLNGNEPNRRNSEVVAKDAQGPPGGSDPRRSLVSAQTEHTWRACSGAGLRALRRTVTSARRAKDGDRGVQSPPSFIAVLVTAGGGRLFRGRADPIPPRAEHL
jgi:hypothetical protein